jgi:hypothetical protein
MRPFFAVFFSLVLLSFGVDAIAVTEGQKHKFDELNLVWTASYGEEGEQVYISTFNENNWSLPVQVSDASEHVLHSSATIAGDDSHWVVWVQSEKEKKLLYFSRYEKGQWSKPSQVFTGMNDNRQVTIAIDTKGQPLIAWTGVDESYSDIFWSRIVNDAWSTARKVHSNNKVPDVDPVLWTSDNGDITLSWQTFTDGSPVTAFLQWDGKSWVEKKQSFREAHSMVQKLRRESLPQVPKFIQEQFKAEFFYKDKYGTGSIPLI